MKDIEIMKALRFCSDPDTCSDDCCFYVEGETIDECTTKLSVAALDLIERQQEYIEAMAAGQETLQKHFTEKMDMIVEQLEEHSFKAGEFSFVNLDRAIGIVKGVQNE